MNPVLVGILAFLVLSFLGYVLREFAGGRISAEQIGALDKRFRPYRIRYAIFIVCVLIVFVVLRYSIPSHMTTWFLITLSVTALATLGIEWIGLRACGLSELPRGFRVPYLVSRVLSLAGLLSLLGAMAATSFIDVKH